MNSVIQAVDSGNLTGLSQSVGELINETADSISRGVNQAGTEIERQAKTHGANHSNAAGVWSADAVRRVSRERTMNMAEMRMAQRMPARYKKFLPGQAAGPACLAVGIVGTSMFGIANLNGRNHRFRD